MKVSPGDIFKAVQADFDGLLDGFATDFFDQLVDKTPVNTGKLKVGWQLDQRADGFEINNDVPYAGYVENGSIHNAPVGMVETTLLEINQLLRKNVQEN